ncbi:MAG: response regulator [Chloroflexi bacterium]|nr:response regulator [Chloroflexota bacterium]
MYQTDYQAPECGLTVLVVDDDARFRNVFARRLAMDGHQVTAVPSGEAALEALPADEWDLVCIQRRQSDPWTNRLAQRVRDYRPSCFVVLVDTATASAADEPRWAPLVDAVLPKPWVGEELRQVLMRAEANRTWLRAD